MYPCDETFWIPPADNRYLAFPTFSQVVILCLVSTNKVLQHIWKMYWSPTLFWFKKLYTLTHQGHALSHNRNHVLCQDQLSFDVSLNWVHAQNNDRWFLNQSMQCCQSHAFWCALKTWALRLNMCFSWVQKHKRGLLSKNRINSGFILNIATFWSFAVLCW